MQLALTPPQPPSGEEHAIAWSDDTMDDGLGGGPSLFRERWLRTGGHHPGQWRQLADGEE